MGGMQAAKSVRHYASPEDQLWNESVGIFLSIRYHQAPLVQRRVLDHIALIGRIETLTCEK